MAHAAVKKFGGRAQAKGLLDGMEGYGENNSWALQIMLELYNL